MYALEKEMATHSSILAWRIPGTEEPGGLPSVGLHRVGHNWSELAAAAEEVHMGFEAVAHLWPILNRFFTTFQPQPRFYAGRFINIFKKKKWVREFRNSDIVATRLTNTPHCYLLFLILKKYRLLIFVAHIQEQKKLLKCLLPPIIWDYIKEVLVNLASFVLQTL